MNSRKRAVSTRMTATDIASVKKIAKRIGVSDSDVIRCAVKMMMSKFGALADGSVCGRNLLPVFVECGTELLRYFDLDAVRLEHIINDGVVEELRIEASDIQLLAGNGAQRSRVRLRSDSLLPSATAKTDGKSAANRDNGHSDSENAGANDCLDDSLRRYLYDKYDYQITSDREQSTEAR